MTADYRAELQHLLTAVENDVIDTNDGLRFQAAVNRARAALAQPEPEGVTDEEIGRCLIAAGVDAMEGESGGTNRMYWEGWHEQIITGIRAVITADRTRFARPTIKPVPVSERPWEREGWCDAEGRCALLSQSLIPDCPTWIVAPAAWGARFTHSYTHSLPHHALPIPAPKGCETGTHPV
jgi:hypothetical protein